METQTHVASNAQLFVFSATFQTSWRFFKLIRIKLYMVIIVNHCLPTSPPVLGLYYCYI